MIKKEKNIKFNKLDMQLLALIAVLLIAITFIFSIASPTLYASNGGFTEIGFSNFDNTDVMTDLTSAENFDIKKYPINKKLDTFIMQNFVEYCYSFDESNRKNYGLYVYLYNPSLIDLDIASYDNKIQLAVEYDNDGKPKNYEKFSLKFCSVSDGDYKRLFYKFKVVDHRSVHDQKTIVERVNSNARKYDISGVELLHSDSFLAVDYGVGKSYVYTGYAVGCGIDGNNAESTLNCNAEKLSTIKLNVEHTFYRTLSSNKGKDYQNQIDTVYFAVSNNYFDNDTNLQRIKAEWYEYKTKEIVVINKKEYYDRMSSYMGKVVGDYNHHLLYPTYYLNDNYNKELGITLDTDRTPPHIDPSPYFVDWCWNLDSNTYAANPCNRLFYIFCCENIEKYDPYADKMDNEFKNKLYYYILHYTNTYINGRLPIKNGTISADLFESDIDDYRKVDNSAGKIQHGYSYYDFDADLDIKHLNSWQSSNPDFWKNWKEYGLWDALTGNIPQEEDIDLSPIVIFNYDDLRLSNEQIIKKYYINAEDVGAFKSYANAAKLKNEKVVLFRFATSDYYSKELKVWRYNFDLPMANAYMAKESVFLNFDIIQLTFKQGDVYTIIPVVSSPIDIVDDPTPPIDFNDGNIDLKNVFNTIFTIILIIVGVIFIIKVIAFIFKLMPQKQKVVINNNGKAKKKKYRHKE